MYALYFPQKSPITRGSFVERDSQDTGWRRLVGCLMSHVSFHKRATNHRALLRKMAYEDEASYDSTPPCKPSVGSWRPCNVHMYCHVRCVHVI